MLRILAGMAAAVGASTAFAPEVAAGASAYIAGIESQRAITAALQKDHVSNEAATYIGAGAGGAIGGATAAAVGTGKGGKEKGIERCMQICKGRLRLVRAPRWQLSDGIFGRWIKLVSLVQFHKKEVMSYCGVICTQPIPRHSKAAK